MAQISNVISNPVVAGIGYWLIRILICGGCLVGAGILVAFIEIKIAELYKKCFTHGNGCCIILFLQQKNG